MACCSTFSGYLSSRCLPTMFKRAPPPDMRVRPYCVTIQHGPGKLQFFEISLINTALWDSIVKLGKICKDGKNKV
jgi:hypothetical protein